MACPKIQNLEDLISPHLDKSKTIKDYKISRLTAYGENYGSTLLKLDMTLTDKTTGDEEDFSVVAKTIPEIEFFRVAFNIQVTCKMEIAFYDTIVPTLQVFQREQGVERVMEFFPKLYGARISLDQSKDVVDDDALLVLENLHTSGFCNANRMIGCDLATTKLVLEKLAQFHATPIALKLLKPEVFQKKIKPHMACYHPENPPPDTTEPDAVLLDVLRDYEECVPLIPAVQKYSMVNFHYASKEFGEPFASISHRDMWVNNFMVRFKADQLPVDIKFVDFQNYTYDSPVRDLIFFLLTSVRFDLLKEKLDYFIQFYYDNFLQTLKDLKCPVKEFSFDKFMEEIQENAKKELGHSMFMALFIVGGKKKTAEEAVDDPTKPPSLGTKDDTNPETRDKLRWVVQEFYRRKWVTLE